jgi:hypothetical protein
MDNGNFEQNEKRIESVYSTRIRAGKRRTYFFDIRATRANDYFLTITESRKRFDNNGYDRHKIFLYKEDFNKFLKAINEALDYVKTELMPDFDFDAFNHEESYDADGNYIGSQTNELTSAAPINDTEVTSQEVVTATSSNTLNEPEQEIDPASITEKKPLEARDTHASQGDNLSGEEVDKW